jgi:glutaminyl-peptide cyclotransferase
MQCTSSHLLCRLKTLITSFFLLLQIFAVIMGLHSCRRTPDANTQISETTPPAPKAIVNYTYKVLNEFPHDETAFTQGLVWLGNQTFLESTGQYSRSDIRRVQSSTGSVQLRRPLSSEYFAEGCCVLQNRIYQITWNEQKGFIYDLETLRPLGEFAYRGEGWGLTTDGLSLIMSNGSSTITYLNPQTFAVERTIDITIDVLQKVRNLNELEFINGKLYANIWMTDSIVIIDPRTGNVEGIIDCSNLLPARLRSNRTDVLNGIAYNQQTDKLYLTGKYWPRVYEVEIMPK